MPLIWDVNNEFYAALPDDLKQIFDDGIEYGVQIAREFCANPEKFRDTITSAGTGIIVPSDDVMREFKDATESVRSDLAAKYPEFFE